VGGGIGISGWWTCTGRRSLNANQNKEKNKEKEKGTDQIILKSQEPSNLSKPANSFFNMGFKDFTMIRVLGKGCVGRVLLVRKNDTGKIYAMKILEKNQILKEKQVRYTQTERSILGNIQHPFIVKLYFAFQTPKRLCLVMQYCPGGELFFHLGRFRYFTESHARFYAAEIVLALEHLHKHSIIYRDLKAENILLDAEGHIILTDFGLAKENVTEPTSAHSFCGTPEYLAPEVILRKGYGKAADWWSFGTLLYEMLTGLPPFYCRIRPHLFTKILKSPLRFPKLPILSSSARSLIKGLLCRDPSNRLGAYGADEIKAHKFFQSVDWDKVYRRELKAPFIPPVKDPLDTQNFATEFTSLPVPQFQSHIQKKNSLDISSSYQNNHNNNNYNNNPPPLNNNSNHHHPSIHPSPTNLSTADDHSNSNTSIASSSRNNNGNEKKKKKKFY